MQHKKRRVSISFREVHAWLERITYRPVVAPASPPASDAELEHRELTEAARPEARDQRAEPAAPEPVSASEDVTAVDGPVEPDAAVRRSHELRAIDGIPADTYPFLPTDRTVDVHVRRCRACGASCDRLRLHFDASSPPRASVFCEYLCSSCA